MTPDEIICTTCEDEGAVVYQDPFEASHSEQEAEKAIKADELYRHLFGEAFPWQIDTCPECGRGREVGKI